MDKLSETYFFKRLDPEEIDALSSITRIIEAEKGGLVIKQGHDPEDLFIVRTGKVRVVLPSGDGDEEVATDAEHTLIVLGAGECFGEFAFVDRQPASATVVADSDATLYAISHADLDRMLDKHPATAAKLYKSLLHVLVARFRNTDIELAMRRAAGF